MTPEAQSQPGPGAASAAALALDPLATLRPMQRPPMHGCACDCQLECRQHVRPSRRSAPLPCEEIIATDVYPILRSDAVAQRRHEGSHAQRIERYIDERPHGVTVTQAAGDLGINYNTVADIFRQLNRAGRLVVAARRGKAYVYRWSETA